MGQDGRLRVDEVQDHIHFVCVRKKEMPKQDCQWSDLRVRVVLFTELVCVVTKTEAHGDPNFWCGCRIPGNF